MDVVDFRSKVIHDVCFAMLTNGTDVWSVDLYAMQTLYLFGVSREEMRANKHALVFIIIVFYVLR